jgi:hypothetical protein
MTLRATAARLYVKFEALLTVVAAFVAVAVVALQLLRLMPSPLEPAAGVIGSGSAVVTVILVFLRLFDAAGRLAATPEGQVEVGVLVRGLDVKLRSFVEKLEQGAAFLGPTPSGFSYRFAAGPKDLDLFVAWSEGDPSIVASQDRELDRRGLYLEWWAKRPDSFLLAMNPAGLPFCGSIVLPLTAQGAALLERDGISAVNLRSAEIAPRAHGLRNLAFGAPPQSLLIDTWVGDRRLQSRVHRIRPPFDPLMSAGYAMRLLHVAHFMRQGPIADILFEPSNRYLRAIADLLPCIIRMGSTTTAETHTYKLPLRVLGQLSAAARDAEGLRSDALRRLNRLVMTLKTLDPPPFDG